MPVAVALGTTVGLGVFAFERTVTFLLDQVRGAPTPVMILAPSIGLVIAAAVLRIGPTPITIHRR